jgi:hypothetical protein
VSQQLQASSPSPSSANLIITTGGVFLPWGLEELAMSTSSATICGAANVQEEAEFISPINITLGHVTIRIGTGVAASLGGIALYDALGTTKLTAKDAFSCAVAGIFRLALSASLTLLANTKYWLAWTFTDSTTLTIFNLLQSPEINSVKNAGQVRSGNSNIATVGGVTGATIGAPVAAQVRVPTLFFDQ